jgi:23S rRNA G2069 N7-methylase RlmK/C1962 C5-methylase RlmI
MIAELQSAWDRRQERGLLAELGSLRVFHGPGEGSGPLANVSIDRFFVSDTVAHYWVTEWESERGARQPFPLAVIRDFLASRGAVSAIALLRPEKGIPAEPRSILGTPPEGRFLALEAGIAFRIQLLGARHPGLFLDHFPLRRWLRARSKGLEVLNTFSYTGSLSVAAGLGGAKQVTTLDLSGATTAWAEENWLANGLALERARFIAGDYFEWLPRLKREGRRFDLVITDPPSFSRSKRGMFSTSNSKDLRKLHAAAFSVLNPGGVLVTSINSANVSWERYADEVLAAATEAGLASADLEVLSRIDLPETFPTRLRNFLARDEERYLKGWILRISSGSGASKTSRS